MDADTFPQTLMQVTADRSRLACVKLPDGGPDIAGISGMPYVGTGAVFAAAASDGFHAGARQAYEALSRFGLLARTEELVAADDGPRRMIRYALTYAGWASGVSTESRKTCLVYGRLHSKGVTHFERYVESDYPSVVMYKVTVALSVDPAEVAAWARDPQVQMIFPEIARILRNGEEREFTLVHANGRWVSRDSYEAMMEIFSRGADGKEVIPLERRKQIAQQLAAPALTPSEIGKLMNGRLSLENIDSCVKIPDRASTGTGMVESRLLPSGKAFVFGVYAEASARERGENRGQNRLRLLKYADSLVDAGVFVRSGMSVPLLPIQDGLQTRQAWKYEMSEKFAALAGNSEKPCFSPGKPAMELLRTEILNRSDGRYPATMFHVKARLHFPDVPTWMNDPELRAAWPEMAHTADDGLACEGTFGFDRVSRTVVDGKLSCRRAFASFEFGY